MTNDIEISGPVTFGKISLMQIFLDHYGMEHITGEYMCWDPLGFHIWIPGNDLPVYVLTREFRFDDYPGDNEPDKEGRVVHVIGKMDSNNMAIDAFRWWFDGEEVPV